ncbi:hypothetical protein DFP73DRAFT_624471 [Morchella snyderi]|nr:hypothetical protein DFP73DRAFT_624471 [Morchella snyderi]
MSLNIVGRDVALLATYDYIIIGGGTSSLTVADRLTEDADKTVLIIESGNLDDQEDGALVPGLAGSTGKKYMYNMTCEPQPGINNRTYSFLAAHVIGGGTVVNGQAFDRGSRGDYDLWEALRNPGWGWGGLIPYFKKSETFTPSPPDIAKQWGIEYGPSAHGFKGPVMSSMPTYYYPAMNGNALGAFFFSDLVDPVTRTRSYARTAHYEPVKGRPNLHLLTGQKVIKLVIEGKKGFRCFVCSITNRFDHNRISEERDNSCRRVRTYPANSLGRTSKIIRRIMLLDYVGDDCLIELEARKLTGATYAATNDMNPSPAKMSNATYAAEMLALYKYNRTGPYSNGFGTAAAFLTLPDIANKTRVSSLRNLIRKQDPSAYLPANTDATHLSSTVYAIAERAADIIKARA